MTTKGRPEEKFVVRFKPGQRQQLADRAKADNQAMNDVMLTAFERHVESQEAFDALLQLVGKAIRPQGGAFVSIKREYLIALRNAAAGKLASSSEPMTAADAVLAIPE